MSDIRDGRCPDTWHPIPGTCCYGFLVESCIEGRPDFAFVESCAIALVFFRRWDVVLGLAFVLSCAAGVCAA